jgi:hypothetical protein
LWELARLDEAYWRAAAENPEQATGSILIARDRLDSLAPAARLRLYLACVRRLAEEGEGIQARADALLHLDALWRKRRSGAVVRLPGIDARLLPGDSGGIAFERRCRRNKKK